jgi:hypothetical protein
LTNHLDKQEDFQVDDMIDARLLVSGSESDYNALLRILASHGWTCDLVQRSPYAISLRAVISRNDRTDLRDAVEIEWAEKAASKQASVLSATDWNDNGRKIFYY